MGQSTNKPEDFIDLTDYPVESTPMTMADAIRDIIRRLHDQSFTLQQVKAVLCKEGGYDQKKDSTRINSSVVRIIREMNERGELRVVGSVGKQYI